MTWNSFHKYGISVYAENLYFYSYILELTYYRDCYINDPYTTTSENNNITHYDLFFKLSIFLEGIA